MTLRSHLVIYQFGCVTAFRIGPDLPLIQGSPPNNDIGAMGCLFNCLIFVDIYGG